METLSRLAGVAGEPVTHPGPPGGHSRQQLQLYFPPGKSIPEYLIGKMELEKGTAEADLLV